MRKSVLMIFGFLWAASGCTVAGFRHYDPIGNCVPAITEQVFKCTDAKGVAFQIPFKYDEVKNLVCFKQTEWAPHEEACRSR